jgi:hypothetical protein
MAITFTWSVKDMHKVTDTGAVYKVEWSCSGVDADTEVSHSRSGSYLHTESVTEDGRTFDKQAIPDHTASGFKAYKDLTETDVLAWCKADGVGAKNEALITSNITNKIADSANSTGMPWAAE